MKYQVHNVTTLTDSWCGDHPTKKAAQIARDTLAKAWPKNQYIIKAVQS